VVVASRADSAACTVPRRADLTLGFAANRVFRGCGLGCSGSVGHLGQGSSTGGQPVRRSIGEYLAGRRQAGARVQCPAAETLLLTLRISPGGKLARSAGRRCYSACEFRADGQSPGKKARAWRACVSDQ
jgi:hypothetical protein